jgi:hypothetical protein
LKTGIDITHVMSSSTLDNPDNVNTSNDDTIKSDNLGFQILQKCGWQESRGLGKNSNGILINGENYLVQCD